MELWTGAFSWGKCHWPDLKRPSDFWLFPKLKGCRYETIEEMKEAVTKVIDTLTQEDIHGAFQNLFERYNKYIAAGGDYFEGDTSFMCVLSIKVPIRKESGNLSYAPRMLTKFALSSFSLLRIFHTYVSWWFSLESEWQQVSSSLQDSSLYSRLSQQCCSLKGLHKPSYFQVLWCLYQVHKLQLVLSLPSCFIIFSVL